MRIKAFRIENFRNIRLAECTDPPDFMVICGGNGCGKSALLNALMTAKERAGTYGNFNFDPHSVSADAEKAQIYLKLEFSDIDRDFVKRKFSNECSESDEIILEISKGGSAKTIKKSNWTGQLLSSYSKSYLGSPGFFDYIDAYRAVPKMDLSNWNADFLSDQRAKETLGATGTDKFRNTKAYLAGLKMQDLQYAQNSHRAGKSEFPDSLKLIRDFFNNFFSPMKFVDVLISENPFKYVIDTPRGNIDIDDLSSGEKEVLNIFIRFHQFSPKYSIILFDEADAHLHPDLERRYLEVLKEIGKGNQLWLTTHSPEMMIAAKSESLYTVLKEPLADGANQFVRVTSNQQLHSVLTEVMGSRGLVSFNQRIIFIEGEESSADREVYEKLYPSGTYHVSFVPAGNSATVRKTAERINELLSSNTGFQFYFSIVDGDINRSLPPPSSLKGTRLFQLPVYHVENFLLMENLILAAMKDMMASECPYSSEDEIERDLKQMVVSEQHIRPYAKALLDAGMAKAAKDAWDSVYNRQESFNISVPSYTQFKLEADKIMQEALKDGSWRYKCKGRDLLRALSSRHGLNYEHFQNVIISKLKEPPTGLANIMNQILAF